MRLPAAKGHSVVRVPQPPLLPLLRFHLSLFKPRPLCSHSVLTDEDLVYIFCIMKKIKINWIHIIKEHMQKAMRLNDYHYPYAVLVSCSSYCLTIWCIGISGISFICSTVGAKCSRRWVGSWKWILSQPFKTSASRCLKITMRGAPPVDKTSTIKSVKAFQIWL